MAIDVLPPRTSSRASGTPSGGGEINRTRLYFSQANQRSTSDKITNYIVLLGCLMVLTDADSPRIRETNKGGDTAYLIAQVVDVCIVLHLHDVVVCLPNTICWCRVVAAPTPPPPGPVAIVHLVAVFGSPSHETVVSLSLSFSLFLSFSLSLQLAGSLARSRYRYSLSNLTLHSGEPVVLEDVFEGTDN